MNNADGQKIFQTLITRKMNKYSMDIKSPPDLEAIINKGRLIIFVWNASEGWRVEYVSKNISLFGYFHEDFYSGEILYQDIIHPDDVYRVINEVSKFTRQKRSEFQQEYRILTKDGEIRWIDDRTIIHYDEKGEVTHFSGLIIDITEKKLIEQELIDSQKHFKALFENIPVSLQLYDNKGLLLYGNKTWENIFEVRENQLINQYNILKDPQMIENGMSDTIQKVLQGKSIEIPDHEYIPSQSHYPGRKRWLRSQVFPLMDSKQQVTFFVIMQLDITDQKKRFEESLKIQQMESISLLAGGIAHDFNNILVGILGNINLMQMEELPTNLNEYLIELEKATNRARDLSSRLLTFSKGGALIKKIVSIVDIIQDSINLVFLGSKSNCVINYDKDLPNVEVDFGQISQTINNLLINASQSMLDGGTVEVNVTFEDNYENNEKQIPLDNYVKVSIKDDGPGIPFELHDQIFTPYFTTKDAGSGLGLATAYSIIKKHGGHIHFYTSDKGSEFYFYLPTTNKAHEEIVENNQEYQQFTGRILIMDDDELVCKTLSSILERIGFTVDISSDGDEALKKYNDAFKNRCGYDLIIMDLTIPGGMGGEETMKLLLQTYPDAKVIVSSGYSNDPILANYQELGFRGILQKPYTITQVQQIISKVYPPE